MAYTKVDRVYVKFCDRAYNANCLFDSACKQLSYQAYKNMYLKMLYKTLAYINAIALLSISPMSIAKSTDNLKPSSEPVAIRTFEKLGGSTEPGLPVNNEDNSLSCSLESWQLIGIFNDGRIRRTRGELMFEITNNGSERQKFVLAELLVKNDRGKALVISNPHRELQGELMVFEPPLEPGETREFTKKMWYTSGWHQVDLKTCRWLQKYRQYWEIYPELKEDSTT